MADFTAGFETGINGNTVSSADVGNATAWGAGSATLVGGSTCVYDNTRAKNGALSMKWVGGGSGASYVYWPSSQADHYGRFYLYAIANPVVVANPIYQCDTARQARIDINASGTLRIIDAPASGDQSGSVAISLNQWIRIEYHIVHSATVGQIEVKLFNSADSTSPSETITSPATWNTGTTPTFYLFGAPASGGTGFTAWWDLVVDNATSYPGPFIDPNAAFNFAPVIYGRGAC